jgi:peptide-methionine (S)-S-oxide reductase
LRRLASIKSMREFSYFLVLVLAAVLTAAELPAPDADLPASASGRTATAVLAGGCFWGVDAVFKHTKGVSEVVSGYAGGSKVTAHYEIVSTGLTGHAEAVKVTYDPSQISYGKLLLIYFGVAHDPTQLNRQGPDVGKQYRSAIFYATEEQKRVAETYIRQLNAAKVFPRQIVTQLEPLAGFYPAEEYHQNYLARNPGNPYIVYNDLPKLTELQKRFPELWTSSRR